MNTTRPAGELRAMVEALEWAQKNVIMAHRCGEKAAELRAAAETAEKAQGEPVAWMDPDDPDEGTAFTKEEWPRHKVALYTHPDPRVAVLEAALVVLIRETQAVADDCHTPRYARLDEALTSARAALGEGS